MFAGRHPVFAEIKAVYQGGGAADSLARFFAGPDGSFFNFHQRLCQVLFACHHIHHLSSGDRAAGCQNHLNCHSKATSKNG